MGVKGTMCQSLQLQNLQVKRIGSVLEKSFGKLGMSVRYLLKGSILRCFIHLNCANALGNLREAWIAGRYWLLLSGRLKVQDSTLSGNKT